MLYLNKDLSQLPQLLQNKVKAGAQRAMQDLVAVEIATKARMALIQAAVSMVDVNEDPASPPEVRWQRQILEELIHDLPDDYASRSWGLFKDLQEEPEVRGVRYGRPSLRRSKGRSMPVV